jgi:hypothetical protein
MIHIIFCPTVARYVSFDLLGCNVKPSGTVDDCLYLVILVLLLVCSVLYLFVSIGIEVTTIVTNDTLTVWSFVPFVMMIDNGNDNASIKNKRPAVKKKENQKMKEEYL